FGRAALWPVLIAIIPKLQPDAKIPRAAKGDHGLQVVAALSRHANLPVLQRALHLERLRLDRLDDFLRLLAFETLLDGEFLCRVAERRNRRVLAIHVPQIHAAL